MSDDNISADSGRDSFVLEELCSCEEKSLRNQNPQHGAYQNKMSDDNKSVDSDRDSFVWEELLEDDDMISEEEGDEVDLGNSCNDFNWDQRSVISAFTVRFDMTEKDDVSVLDVSLDDRTSDSTILSITADSGWFSVDTEIDVSEPFSKQTYTDTIGDAIRLEKREQKRSEVMAKMLRLESSMKKLGVQLGYSSAE